MYKRIRQAKPSDANSFLRIKNALSFKHVNGETTSGGFLLGTDLATYQHYIEEASCLVAELNGEVIGFGILLDDRLLRGSDIWKRRHQASWLVDLNEYESKQLCYFEQLAFLPGHRTMVLSLAYQLVKSKFDAGAEILITTTVQSPILNLAAIPFIHAVEGFKAGSIEEEYAFIGRIESSIYFVMKEQFITHTQSHVLYPRIQQQLGM